VSESKTNKSKRIFLLLRVAVVVAGIVLAIIWVCDEQRWAELKAIFEQMSKLAFAATLVIFGLSQLLTGARWWLLLRTQGVFISYWAAVRLYLLGWFYNNVMPSSVGGDLVRLWYVTKHTDKKFEAALSVFVDRIVGLFSTLIIAAFFYMLFLRNQAEAVTFTGRSGPLKLLTEYKRIIILTICIFVVIFCAMLLNRRGRVLLQKAWLHIQINSLRMFQKFKNALIAYSGNPLTILAAFVLTVSLQIMVITSFWFLGNSLGITASLKYYYVFFTLTWVLGALPVSVGGAVVVEGTLAYLFIQYAGVEKEAAFALVMCQRIIWMLASLPGAVIHLLGAHLPKDFFVDYEEPVV